MMPSTHSNAAVADGAVEAHEQGTAKLLHLAEQAESFARRSAEALLDGSHQVREKALVASDRTIAYIRDEPVKAVLIAAAAGAAMVALANLLSRSRH